MLREENHPCQTMSAGLSYFFPPGRAALSRRRALYPSGGTMDEPASELKRYRPYLGMLARLHLGTRWQRKGDESDLVQQTMLEACRSASSRRNCDEAVTAAWLRTILAR